MKNRGREALVLLGAKSRKSPDRALGALMRLAAGFFRSNSETGKTRYSTNHTRSREVSLRDDCE